MTTLQPVFAYAGFRTDIQLPLYGASLLLVLIFSPFIAYIQNNAAPSSIILTFINHIYFIPLTSYCGCGGDSRLLLAGTAYWTLLLLYQFRLPVLQLKELRAARSRQLYLALTVFSSLFVLYISGRYAGFRLTLNISDVYGIRAEADAYNLPRLFSYLLAMMGIVLAILLLYWLTRKKYWTAAVLVVVYLFLYSISALKTLLFFLILLLAGYCLFRPWMLRWMGGLLALLAGAAVLERKITGSVYLTAYFFERCMYLLAQLSGQYMSYFGDHPVSLYRDSILGKLPLISPLYSTEIPKILGEFRNHIGQIANNGLLGDLFANLPALLGILLLPLILIIVFRLLDAAAHNLPQKITVACCAYYAVIFSNGSWSGALLSSGYLAACLLFYFFPREESL